MSKMILASSQSQAHSGIGTGEVCQSTVINLRALVTGCVRARAGLWQAIESEAHLYGPKEVSDAIQLLVSDAETFVAVQSAAQESH